MSTQDVDIKDGEDQVKNDRIVRQRTKVVEVSHQLEIMEEILSRLPIKNLLQFMCISKPWLSLMSEPSFIKLHNTRNINHGLLISAYDTIKLKTYFIFASDNGSSITSLLTIPDWGKQPYDGYTAQHVNGLLLFCPSQGLLLSQSLNDYYLALAFVFNPATRKIFKVPASAAAVSKSITENFYFLGFDETTSQHKILNIKIVDSRSFIDRPKSKGLVFEIFSLSDYSWRKVDVDFGIDPRKDYWEFWKKGGVCVNSVIYFLLHNDTTILAFDLRTETFSTMDFPSALESSHLSLTKINNFLGVLAIGKRMKEIEVWILEDYKNEVWVKQTITWPYRWRYLKHFSVDTFGTDELIFPPYRSLGREPSVPFYNMKQKLFRSEKLNLSHEFLCSGTLTVAGVKSYTESIVPLKNSATLAAFLSGERID